MHLTRSKNEGQVAIIALLVLVIVITVGLSLYSRSTLDLSLSRQAEQGSRTFQAAESGAEQALSQNFDTLFTSGDTVSNNLTVSGDTPSQVKYTITRQSSVSTRVEEGESIQIDTTGMVNGNGVTITWGIGQTCTAAPGSTNPSELLIRIYNKNGTTYTAHNFGLAACGTYGANDFTNTADSTHTISAVTGDSTQGYTTIISLKTNDVLVSIQPLYNSTTVAIRGSGWTLPAQYYAIQVNATARQSASDPAGESSSLQLNRTIPQYPYILDYALYSGGPILKSAN